MKLAIRSLYDDETASFSVIITFGFHRGGVGEGTIIRERKSAIVQMNQYMKDHIFELRRKI